MDSASWRRLRGTHRRQRPPKRSQTAVETSRSLTANQTSAATDDRRHPEQPVVASAANGRTAPAIRAPAWRRRTPARTGAALKTARHGCVPQPDRGDHDGAAICTRTAGTSPSRAASRSVKLIDGKIASVGPPPGRGERQRVDHHREPRDEPERDGSCIDGAAQVAEDRARRSAPRQPRRRRRTRRTPRGPIARHHVAQTSPLEPAANRLAGPASRTAAAFIEPP